MCNDSDSRKGEVFVDTRVSVPHCTPQILRGLAGLLTRPSAVTGRPLTGLSVPRPLVECHRGLLAPLGITELC